MPILTPENSSCHTKNETDISNSAVVFAAKKSALTVTLLLLAQKHGVDGILFGHTHVPESRSVPSPWDPEKNVFLFNPGSVGRSQNHSYGVIHIVNGQISAGHGSTIG